ncbi:MAG: RsmB/NOP family class I SAM-dependent RNA methyltransferase [Candidatus Bathyarchaeia archaeon]
MDYLAILNVVIPVLNLVETRKWSEKRAFQTVLNWRRSTRHLRLSYSIVLETIKRLNTIDKILQTVYPEWSKNAPSVTVSNLLRFLLHWVKFGDGQNRIEDVVRAARNYIGWRSLERFESGLGKLISFGLEEFLEGLDEYERLSLSLFHPVWLIKYYMKLFGRRFALKLLKSNLVQPPVYIRLNTLKEDEARILEQLRRDGIELAEVKGLSGVYRVGHAQRPLAATRSYRRGLFQIQDKSSCMAVWVANPRPGEDVLDVCAAPGGKTSLIASMMKNSGRIISLDYSKERMPLFMKRMRKLRVKNSSPLICDCAKPLPLKAKFNLVILDPPCSGTGVLMKYPSMKWRLSRPSFQRFHELQLRMLTHCADHVKRGGRLIYSTCSLTLEENEEVVNEFLLHRPDFEIGDVDQSIGLPGLTGLKDCRRLYPFLHECNGYFIANLVKD